MGLMEKGAKTKADSDDVRRRRLAELLKTNSFLKGEFILASGERSNTFFDVKMTSLHPEGAWLAADLILDMVQSDNLQAVGGIAVGACPIISAICIRSFERGIPLSGFYVRKEMKDHGTRKRIEGPALREGDRVLLVDDVATKGGSMLEAVQPVLDSGAIVARTIVVVDREQGATQRLKEAGLVLEALFQRRELEAGYE